MVIVKWGLIVCYFAVIIGLGAYATKKTHSIDDFVVGGRAIGPWMSAFSYGAANFSAGIFIGFAGKIGWSYGMGGLFAAIFGSVILATYLPWKILAQKTREMTSRLNALTMPTFFETRYCSSKMKVTSTLIIFIFFIPYAASLFLGMSYLFEQIFGIPYQLVVLMMGIVVAAYLMFGGYKAVVLVDFVQGSVMLLGALLLAYFVAKHPAVGGVINGISQLKAIDPELVFPTSAVSWVGILAVILATGFGPWGLPDMIQRFYGVKSEKVIPVATRVSTVFALIISVCAYYVGSTGHLFFRELPSIGGQANADLIVPMIIGQLPELLGAFVLILIMSATMSTLSAIILSASSTITIDLIKGTIKKDIKDKATMILLRILCILFIITSLYLALNPPAIMMTLITLSTGTVAGTFLAAFFYGLYWPRTTKAGAWAGMATGFIIAVGGYIILQYGSNFINAPLMELFRAWGMPFFAALAMITPLAVVPIVSLFTKPFTEKHIDVIYNKIPA